MKRSWRLTAEQKDEIARAYVRGETSGVLAERYGISPRNIRNLMKSRNIPMRPSGRTPKKIPVVETVEIMLPQLSIAELKSVRRTATEILKDIGVE